jgi:hypothetical protein
MGRWIACPRLFRAFLSICPPDFQWEKGQRPVQFLLRSNLIATGAQRQRERN